MSKLYKELAGVYEAMYATFIDYKEEFTFYKNIVRTYHKNSVLEIGSGTGNLARLFVEDGFMYFGLDLSVEMLEIAQKNNPNCVFLEGDMRSFKLENPIDSVLITGRSISYLLKNKDLNLAFKSIHKNLNKDGIVCFDFIDANRFIPEIVTNPNVIHGAHFKGNKYVRESKWSLHLEYGMDLKWEVNYFKEIAAKKHQIAEDVEIIRCFTKNEIVLFLTINNFEIVEILDRKTYAFPTYVIVAKKI